MKNKFIGIIILIMFLPSIQAATFCVVNSMELQNALDEANINKQNNIIKIAVGNYTTPGFQFNYNAANSNTGWNLEIIGGWSEFFKNPCGQQIGSTPFDTVLDGNSNNRVMELIASGNADITIRDLTFINGMVDGLGRGGGLRIRSIANNHTGNLILERSAFINNEANYGSAFNISEFNKTVIKNNLLADNNARTGLTAEIIQNNQYGIYFTNNTVINNTQENDNGWGTGVQISACGSSNAAIYNNLLWGNETNDLGLGLCGKNYFLSNNDIAVRVGADPISDSGNISLSPELNLGVMIYTPSFNSPLVDAGTKPPENVPFPIPFKWDWNVGLVDFLGNVRTQGSKVDIGAFESAPEMPIFINGFEFN